MNNCHYSEKIKKEHEEKIYRMARDAYFSAPSWYAHLTLEDWYGKLYEENPLPPRKTKWVRWKDSKGVWHFTLR